MTCVNVQNVMDFIYELVQVIKFLLKRLYVLESKRNIVINGVHSTPH